MSEDFRKFPVIMTVEQIEATLGIARLASSMATELRTDIEASTNVLRVLTHARDKLELEMAQHPCSYKCELNSKLMDGRRKSTKALLEDIADTLSQYQIHIEKVGFYEQQCRIATDRLREAYRKEGSNFSEDDEL